jgi:cytochrome c oxidase subunit 4
MKSPASIQADLPHWVTTRVYLMVFLALLTLTALTVWAAFHDWGRLNTPIALGIAVVKASLVVWFFMHVRHVARLTQLVVVAGFFWLMVLFAFTLSDYLSRGLLPFPGK